MENSNGVPSVAGWHDDPEDPNYIRYSNGRSWSGERVPKDRNITLKNDNVYRPGGGLGSAPKQEEVVAVEPEPVAYQPMTRRERRLLEVANTKELEPMSEMFEEDFEFQTAPVVRSYTQADKANEVKEVSPPAQEEASLTGLAFFDGFEDVFPKEKVAPEAVSEEHEDEEEVERVLPSLGFADDFNDFTAKTVIETEDEAENEVSALPALGDSDGYREELPDIEEPEGDTETEEDEYEDEFFSDSGSNETGVEDEEIEEDDFAVAEPVIAPAIVERRSYEAPPAKEETPEASPIAEVNAESAPVQQVVSPIHEEAEDESAGESFDVTVGPQEPEEDAAEEDAPVFGFKSKLTRTFDEPQLEAPAPSPTSPAPVDAASEDEDKELQEEDASDENEPQRDGFGGKLRSLFGRKPKEYLDYEYKDEDEENASEAEPEAVPPVPVVVEQSKKKETAVALTPAEEPVVDEIEDEEPQLKAGLFSSRQAKEDAAVEVELIDRLKELAARVAALKKEEAETLARVEAAKLQEQKLNALIVQAHEEHELLDQLAKARTKELEGNHEEKEDNHFLDFLEAHENPAEEKSEPATTTVSLHLVKDEEENEPDDSSSSLPELKLN